MPVGLRLGFVPLLDSAPVLVADRLGLFARHGVKVRLSRELGWASVRDKLAYGELEAAHAPCGLPFALHFGMGVPRTACVTPLILSRNGNAITVSHPWHAAGVVDATGLARQLRANRGEVPTFGVVANCSTHAYLLRRWLAGGGLLVDRDVRMVVVPPPQMPVHLKSGHLAGFCAGEPWNTVAELSRHGKVVATSGQLADGHLEKVLAVRKSVVLQDEARVVALTAALLEACTWCSDPENLDEMLAILSGPMALEQPVSLLRAAWTGRRGRVPVSGGAEFSSRLADLRTGEPTLSDATWVLEHVFPDWPGPRPSRSALADIHRADLFQAAVDGGPTSFRSLHESVIEHEKAVAAP